MLKAFVRVTLKKYIINERKPECECKMNMIENSSDFLVNYKSTGQLFLIPVLNLWVPLMYSKL